SSPLFVAPLMAAATAYSRTSSRCRASSSSMRLDMSRRCLSTIIGMTSSVGVGIASVSPVVHGHGYVNRALILSCPTVGFSGSTAAAVVGNVALGMMAGCPCRQRQVVGVMRGLWADNAARPDVTFKFKAAPGRLDLRLDSGPGDPR